MESRDLSRPPQMELNSDTTSSKQRNSQRAVQAGPHSSSSSRKSCSASSNWPIVFSKSAKLYMLLIVSGWESPRCARPRVPRSEGLNGASVKGNLFSHLHVSTKSWSNAPRSCIWRQNIYKVRWGGRGNRIIASVLTTCCPQLPKLKRMTRFDTTIQTESRTSPLGFGAGSHHAASIAGSTPFTEPSASQTFS